MFRILLSMLFVAGTTSVFAQKDTNRFAVTVKIDSAIASEPQKMYMYSMIELEVQSR